MNARLKRYQQKRDFEETPEPQGGRSSGRGPAYVVQEHHASRLHWDFRLEYEGVLLSWAVPKGPSLDPKERRLAVHVEDHPLDYADFEGTIPEGQYGAGQVYVWDEGTWEPAGDVAAMLEKRALKFTVHGTRLRGKWTLIGLKDDEESWLLIKERDEHALPGDDDGVVRRATGSVRTQASFNPEEFSPQLATLSSEAPAGDDWVHEIKYDGYRILAWKRNGGIRLMSRGGQDWTHRFKKLARTLERALPDGTAVDGEVVVLDEEGRSDFSSLQAWLKTVSGPTPVYFVFDLIELEGEDQTSQPLLERKRRLRGLFEDGSILRFSDHLTGPGPENLAAACWAGLEGIVSKQCDSRYSQSRNGAWLKVKCHAQEEFVIGGYTDPEGARTGFGAMLVGQYDVEGRLVYQGKVGGGLEAKELRDLLARFKKLPADQSPFTSGHPPKQGVHWVRPDLVAAVKFSERTASGMLRQPVFLGLREDKRPQEATPEKAIQHVEVTHPDRVVFPDVGVTKRQLADYYEIVAEAMLQHVANRPIALVRCPSGAEGECFFQKRASQGMFETLERETGDPGEAVLAVSTAEELVTLVQYGVVEVHAWGSTLPRIEEPNLMVIDLDPGPDVPWSTVLEATHVVGEFLRSVGLVPFAKTSGGKGFHVSVPIQPGSVDWDAFVDFAHQAVSAIDRLVPRAFVTVMTKARRKSRIFLDYLRNGRGQTSVAPYSARRRSGAPVSVPIAWDRVNGVQDPRQMNVLNADAWLKDSIAAWRGFGESARPIDPEMIERVANLAGG